MRNCSECRRWEGNLSHEENLKRRFHFFRLLIGNFTNKLGIPPRFAENFLSGEHVQALLRGPSGNVWKVQLKRNGDGFFFMKGWKEFVEDHHLNEGDFLMFRYNGYLRFTVLIFNRTACQREDAKFAKNTRNAPKHEEDDSNHHKEGTMRADSAKTISQPYKGEKETSVHSKFVLQQLHGKDQVDSSKQISSYFLPRRRPVTRAEKAVVLKAASFFNSCCPFCVTVMKSDSVNFPYKMNIPVEFAKARLSERKHSTIVLRNASGGEWTVSFGRKGNTLTFIDGWRTFVLGNNLMEGDVCIFELLGGQNDFILNIIIYRVVDEVILHCVLDELDT